VTNEHPYREEDFDLYALGVLENDERTGIESHIASCSACSQKLAEARGRIALLALSAEPQEPSLAVRQRLLEQIRANRISGQAASPSQIRRAPARWWTAAWATAAFALAACAVVLWMANARMGHQIDDLQKAAARQTAQLERTRAIAALLTSPQTVTVNLAPKAPMATEPGRVLYNSQQGALIYAGTLPQLAAGKSYELWVIPQTGNPIPAGVFSAQPNGEANVVMPQIPVGVSAKAFAVTIEPAGGATAPTGPMAQVGAGL
jgi:anti-sigma-K factor RskA